MTFKHYNPHTKKTTWKSVNTSGFTTEGQNCKSDAFVRGYSLFTLGYHIAAGFTSDAV
jgi:hypothetical protein